MQIIFFISTGIKKIYFFPFLHCPCPPSWHLKIRSKFSIIVIAASSASFLVMVLSLLASTSRKISVKFSKPYCSSVSKQSGSWISLMVNPSLLRSQALNVALIKSTVTRKYMSLKYAQNHFLLKSNSPERFGMMQMNKMKSLMTNMLAILPINGAFLMCQSSGHHYL